MPGSSEMSARGAAQFREETPERDGDDRFSLLIVDDNPLNLQMLASILAPDDYQMALVKSGEKALRFIQRKKPDLILLDVMMHGIDGFEVCRECKLDPDLDDIPVIFISALKDADSKLKGFELGGVDYITKPFHNLEVRARVQTHLRLRRLQKDLARRVEEEVAKRMEQQRMLIQKSKLESLGRLAAGIAHEINQPLAGISMGLDNMEFKIEAGRAAPDYLTGKIASLRKDMDRIHNIIQHVRLFSRDQAAVILENVDVNGACADALSMLGTQYRQHDVRVRLDLDEDAGCALGNRYRLEQVVVNLLTNAKDAVDRKAAREGELSFEKRIRIGTRRLDGEILLTVSDNGVGIPEDLIDRLFEPFFTTKEPEKGTGLGLAISYGIIREMKGEIRVESDPGRTTCVKVRLPRISDVKR